MYSKYSWELRSEPMAKIKWDIKPVVGERSHFVVKHMYTGSVRRGSNLNGKRNPFSTHPLLTIFHLRFVVLLGFPSLPVPALARLTFYHILAVLMLMLVHRISRVNVFIAEYTKFIVLYLVCAGSSLAHRLTDWLTESLLVHLLFRHNTRGLGVGRA